MENLDNIFGKKVISLSQGNILGYVLDICVEEGLKSLLGLIIADEESEQELFLPLKKIVSQNDECIFVESSVDTQLVLNQETNNPLGKKVYDRKGTDLGKVVNLILNGGKIDKIVTDKGEIKQKHVYCDGNDCIIFSNTKNRNYNNSRPFYKKTETKLLPKIEIMTPEKNIPSAKKMEIGSPVKLTTAASMLINKTATCDIFGYNNELIIRKGEIITENKLNKVKKHEKINYLIFNSK